MPTHAPTGQHKLGLPAWRVMNQQNTAAPTHRAAFLERVQNWCANAMRACRAALPGASVKPAKCCGVCIQGCLIQGKCGISRHCNMRTQQPHPDQAWATDKQQGALWAPGKPGPDQKGKEVSTRQAAPPRTNFWSGGTLGTTVPNYNRPAQTIQQQSTPRPLFQDWER